MYRIRYFTAVLAVILAAGSSPVFASVIYSNGTNFSGYMYSPGVEFGDEITLNGTDREVTYWGVYLSSNGAQTFDLVATFYANDGALGEPGTVLWTQAYTGVSIDGAVWADMPVPNVVVPDTFTWTIQTGNNNVGALIFDPPTVGSSDDFFWVNAGGWGAYYFGGSPVANFGAYVEGVPEPATLMMLGLGMLVMALPSRNVNRRRNARRG